MSYLSFYIQEQVSALTAKFFDTTLWGVNGVPLQTQVSSAVLTISLPDPTTLLPDTNNQVSIDILALGYPLTNPITLTSVDFGQALATDKIPDGIYGFSLEVEIGSLDPPDIVTTVWYGYFRSQATCCADNLANTLPCKCTDCLTPKQMRLLKMRLDLYSISLNELYCQDNNSAAIALKDAQELCNGGRCVSCGC